MMNCGPICSVRNWTYWNLNATVPYPTMHHFVTTLCILLRNGALWDIWLTSLLLPRPYMPFAGVLVPWWRHQMETFSALLAVCAGNSPVSGEFPAQRPVTRSFDVLFDLRLNERLGKQSLGWWFETSSPPLSRHSNGQVGSMSSEKSYWLLLNSSHRHIHYSEVKMRIKASQITSNSAVWSTVYLS